jgi:hydroxyethylthiazole kinase
VDSADAAESALAGARALGAQYGCVVCVSGATDYIVGREGTALVRNGHALMPRVTGLGCTATALCGAFAAVEPDPFRATVSAMAIMGIAGEIAAERSPGPGSLQANFIDALYALDGKAVKRRLKLEFSLRT